MLVKTCPGPVYLNHSRYVLLNTFVNVITILSLCFHVAHTIVIIVVPKNSISYLYPCVRKYKISGHRCPIYYTILNHRSPFELKPSQARSTNFSRSDDLFIYLFFRHVFHFNITSKNFVVENGDCNVAIKI